jgi:hypothetical protein
MQPVPAHVRHRKKWTRFQAAQQWLYAAAKDREAAVQEFRHLYVAVLTAGIMWDAVRVPCSALGPDLDYATGSEVLRGLLREWELSGPVFCDPRRPTLYFLVPPGTDRTWPADLAPLGVDCLGSATSYIHHVGVPRADRVALPGPHWLTPPDGTGRYVDPQRLYAVLAERAVERADR